MHPVAARQVGERAVVAVLGLLAELVLDDLALELAWKIDNGSLIPTMLSGALDGVFEKMAKGQPVDLPVIVRPSASANRR
ncbi:MAG TPA: hypothetical protein VGV57_05850 [Thermoleophilaceae bacterium]|nr:hypothetical protein [Thermoleophilaceae bacterium]